MDQRQLQIVLKLQDEASKELRKLSGEVDNAEKSTSRWGGSLDYVAKAAKYAIAALSAAGLAGATWGIKTAAQLETAEVGLKTLLGSGEKAAKTMERLKKEAARTPFELPGLSQAVQLLTSVTKDGDKSIDIIMDVGEALAAMGKGQPELDRIIVNLQQIAATGRAALIDVRQFAFAGIPIYEMLTEQTGLAGEALADFISEGGVTFDLLTEMFDKANDSGGQFFEAFKNQSGTFNQAMSNMKDSVSIFLADLVKETGIFDKLTEAMITASDWLMDYKNKLKDLWILMKDFIQTLDEKTGLVTLLKDAWASIVAMYREELGPALQELWQTLEPYKPYIEALAKVFGVMLLIAIGGVIIIVAKLVEWFIKLLTWATKIADFFSGLFIVGLNAVKDTIAAVITAVDNLIEKFKSAWEWAGKIVSKTSGFVSNAATSAWNFVTGRASGGPVTGGTPYLVGERGPELFTPSQNGRIIPNSRMGGQVIINITGNTLLDDEAGQKIGDMIMNRLRLNTKLGF